MSMRTLVLNSCIGTLLCVLSLPALAQLRGTLFTSPEQRAYLDYLRQDFLAQSRERGFDIQEAEIPEIPDGAVQEQAPEIYTLSGIMARHDGSHTFWLNGQVLSENELPEGVTLTRNSGVLALRFATATGVHFLKPGQTLELTAGSVVEAYQHPQAAPVEEPEPATPAYTEETTTAAETVTTATENLPEDTATNTASTQTETVTTDMPEDESDADTELGRQEIELQIERLQNLLEVGDEQ